MARICRKFSLSALPIGRADYISDAGGVRNYLTIYTLSSEEAVRTPEFAKARGWGRFKEKVRYSTRLYARLESTHE